MINLRFAGQSIAQITGSNQPVTTSQFRVSGPPPTPDHIAATGGGGTLMYPSDRPKYFMQFDVFDYKRAGIQQMALLSPRGSIVLPLSEHLMDSLEAKWQEEPIGFVAGAAADNIFKAFKGVGSTPDQGFGDQAKQVAAQGQAQLQQIAGQMDFKKGLVSASAALSEDSGLTKTLSVLTGLAPNRFVTILYIGPEYKRHTFSWNFSPRNAAESGELINIYNQLKNFMSPTIEGGGLLWGYPCVFQISFMPNADQMYKFKPAILER